MLFLRTFSAQNTNLKREKAMNKKTKALTTEQYKEIIQTMREGFSGCRPNERIATALVLEGNLGLRISDVLRLRQCDIVRDGERYRLEIVEKKTGKRRIFTVPLVLYQYIENYCLRNSIGRSDIIFPITERTIQKQLHIVCDYLGYEGISTHSFRKWYATEIYKNSGYDIALVQRLLQHSSASTTQRYIGMEPQKIEQAIEGHAMLL
jgi:integrase